jgi:hypothetical protein
MEKKEKRITWKQVLLSAGGFVLSVLALKEHEGRVKAESKVELLEQQNRRLQNDLRKAEYYKGRLSEREQQK